MPASDSGNSAAPSLTAKLSELESLIGDRKGAAQNGGADAAAATPDIPILDELVEADDVDINEWGRHMELPAGAADQMLHLIDNIERRLTDELEALMHTLKTSMKSSIMEELMSRMDAPAVQGTASARAPEQDAPVIAKDKEYPR